MIADRLTGSNVGRVGSYRAYDVRDGKMEQGLDFIIEASRVVTLCQRSHMLRAGSVSFPGWFGRHSFLTLKYQLGCVGRRH
ncbi:MAG: hypothetical protein AB8U69_02890 [Anaplasma ovis]|uniref:hypothetical protein n=1 Tax=Anaplasma ovis TaxID=142058 RepID=UPI000947544E|nr:hypothetical protein [Anaplasma ovis]